MKMLEMKGLGKRLGRKQILHDLTLTLEPGVYGLLGANGAGKTTLLRCLTGLYRPTAGAILYQGTPIGHNPAYWRAMGYLPQAFGMFKELTVGEMLEYFCAVKRLPREQWPAAVARCLEAVNLMDCQDTRVSALSGGMIRRAGIAQALIGEPQLLYFDEPTAGLDPEERARFKSVIASLPPGRIVVVSTHIVDDVATGCVCVIVIPGGRVIFLGPCEKLRHRAAGRVYEREASQPAADAFTLRTIQREGVLLNRVLSERPLGGPPVEPTLEDGYMCVIKGLSV